METDRLAAALKSGAVTAEVVAEAFAEGSGLPEEWKLRAALAFYRKNPQAARPFFARIDPVRMAGRIKEARLEAALLSAAVQLFPDSELLVDAVLASMDVPSPVLRKLGEHASGLLLGRLVRDEARLIVLPELAAALLRNPNVDEEQKARLGDILRRVAEDDQLKVRPEFRPGALSAEDRALLIADGGEAPKDEPGRENKKKDSVNIYAKILKMTVAEKILLATLGNREARMILIRDPNRLISKAVMRSPRVTDKDIEYISKMRDVDDEVLRMIADSRRWMRKHAIIKNIVTNPRTPPPIAIANMNQLGNLEMKILSGDKNIPQATRRMALNIARQRGLR